MNVKLQAIRKCFHIIIAEILIYEKKCVKYFLSSFIYFSKCKNINIVMIRDIHTIFLINTAITLF